MKITLNNGWCSNRRVRVRGHIATKLIAGYLGILMLLSFGMLLFGVSSVVGGGLIPLTADTIPKFGGHITVYRNVVLATAILAYFGWRITRKGPQPLGAIMIIAAAVSVVCLAFNTWKLCNVNAFLPQWEGAARFLAVSSLGAWSIGPVFLVLLIVGVILAFIGISLHQFVACRRIRRRAT